MLCPLCPSTAGYHHRHVLGNKPEDLGSPWPFSTDAATRGNCTCSFCLSSPVAGDHLPGFCKLESAPAHWPNICMEQQTMHDSISFLLHVLSGDARIWPARHRRPQTPPKRCGPGTQRCDCREICSLCHGTTRSSLSNSISCLQGGIPLTSSGKNHQQLGGSRRSASSLAGGPHVAPGAEV